MKRLTALFVVVISMVFVEPAFATELSEDQRGAISMGCSTIKNQLDNLQITDSATRVHLGASYQTLLDNYMTPMNVRLVKNGKLVYDLNTILSDFNSTRAEFNAKFISYSKALESLSNSDCKDDPDGFYEKLENVRWQRHEVAGLVSKLRDILSRHIVAVSGVKDV